MNTLYNHEIFFNQECKLVLNDGRKRNSRNCVIHASEAASEKLHLVLYVKQVIIFGRKKKTQNPIPGNESVKHI